MIVNLLRNKLVWVAISVTVLSLYLLPLLIHSDTLYVRIHDYLDITVPMLKILAGSGMIFADSSQIVPNMMGGLPRLVYGSECNYLLWLFYFFDPLTAVVINEIAIHLVAFVSMTVLLKHLLEKEVSDYTPALIYVASLAFAMTPFFPATGMGVALLPYATYVFLKLRVSGGTKGDWIGLTLIPFFGNLVLIYFFFILVVGVVIIFEAYRTKRPNIRVVGALLYLSVLFIAAEYRLLYSMISPDFVSHRVEFVRKCVGFGDTYRGIHNVFLWGQVHSINLQFPYLLALVNTALVVGLFRGTLTLLQSRLVIVFYTVMTAVGGWESVLASKFYLPVLIVVVGWMAWKIPAHRLMYLLIGSIIASSVWYGIWYSQWWWNLSHESLWLRIMDLSRFVLLLTPVWYVAAVLATLLIVRHVRYGWSIAVIGWGMQCAVAFGSPPFFQNPEGVNFKKFYDEKLFGEIISYIGKDTASYRVASVGIHPGVSLYNGFYTLDGYAPNYPLAYKHRWISLERENFGYYPNTRDFLQKWGNKCYLVGPYDYDQYEKGKRLEKLYLDTAMFQQMGGRYLLSGYEIADTEGEWELRKKFASPAGYWEVYLYEPAKNQK